MSICTLYLLSLNSSLSSFIASLRKTSISPLIAAKVIRWVIPPTVLSVESLVTNASKWNVMLVLPGTEAISSSLDHHVSALWSIQFDMPEESLTTLTSKNKQLLHPQPGDVPARAHELDKLEKFGSGASLHSVELSKEDQAWMLDFIEHDKAGNGAVSMLNLLAFKDQARYMQYAGALNEAFGKRSGLVPKFIASAGEQSDGAKEWDVVALIHYPSLGHFGDMIASAEYPSISHKYREGALVDNPLLFTSELAWEDADADGKSTA